MFESNKSTEDIDTKLSLAYFFNMKKNMHVSVHCP